MTQGELNSIWDDLEMGIDVAGWGRMLGGNRDEDVLVEIAADHTWNRYAGVESWVKTPK